MDHLKRRSICKSCRVCFVRDNDTQVYCHSCLVDAHQKAQGIYIGNESKERGCLICHKKFIPRYSGGTCSDQCKKELNSRNWKDNREKEAKREADKESLSVEAKRWLDTKERVYGKPIPYSELNRRAEYNRVFGKHSTAPLYFKRKGYGR